MTVEVSTGAERDPEEAERTVLEEVVELLPVRLTVSELCQRIIAGSQDKWRVEAVRHAIRDLRGWSLLRYRDDVQLVEPPPAAVQAFTLLTR
jgi:hypothetical protein